MSDEIIRTENETEEVTVSVVRGKTLTFQIPDLPEGYAVTANIEYYADDDNTVTAIGWLRNGGNPLMQFVGDSHEFNAEDLSDDEIEDAIISYMLSSEEFNNSVIAVAEERYEYFNSDDNMEEIANE